MLERKDDTTKEITDPESAKEAVHILCSEFLQISKKEELDELKAKALNISDKITTMNPTGEVSSLESAGDKIVVVLGYIDLIERDMMSLSEAIDRMRTAS